MGAWAKKLGWFGAGVATTLVLVVLSGAVFAQGFGGRGKAAWPADGERPMAAGLAFGKAAHAPLAGGLMADVAESLGMTVDELAEARRNQQSVADIAAEKGIALEQVKQDVLAAARQRHDEQVAAVCAGAEDKWEQLAERLDAMLDEVLTATGPAGGPRFAPRFRGEPGKGRGPGPGRGMGPGFGWHQDVSPGEQSEGL